MLISELDAVQKVALTRDGQCQCYAPQIFEFHNSLSEELKTLEITNLLRWHTTELKLDCRRYQKSSLQIFELCT